MYDPMKDRYAMITDYSVLMPLWHGERLDFLEQSLKSMVQQSIPPQEFVFILDHPIPNEMRNLIQQQISNFAHTHFVEAYHLQGKGLGALLQIGVTECTCPFIARMDSDDISISTRCAKELHFLNASGKLAVVGSFLSEFEDSPNIVKTIRKVPEQGMDIIRFSKFRNPVNHPTVMFRKDAITAIGNYCSHFSYCEDYELWYRMIQNGFEIYNIQESLLYYRIGNNFFDRRSRKGNLESYIQLKKIMWQDGFINLFEYYISIFTQYFFSHAPTWIKEIIYIFLRTKPNER